MQTDFLSLTAVPFFVSAQIFSVGTAQASSLPTQVARIIEAEHASEPIPELHLRAWTSEARSALSKAKPSIELTQPAAIAALERIRTFRSWKRNWDGEMAPAPKPKSLDAAAVLLGLLDAALPSTPKVTLNGIGEPMFILLTPELEFSATVTSSKRVAYYVRSEDREEAGLARFDHVRLPKVIRQELGLVNRRYA